MPTHTYRDFVLAAEDVEPGSDGSVRRFQVRVFDSPVGQGEAGEWVEPPSGLQPALEDWHARRLDADPAAQIRLGKWIADLLLPPAARRMLTSALDNLSAAEGLRLRLRLADPLAVYPWEFAHLHEVRGESTPSSFLALDTRISIRRDPALPFPADPAGAPPLRRRVLFASAAPAGLPPLPDLARERAALQAALASVPALDLSVAPEAELQPEHGATLPDLAAALALAPADVFHFSGHGVFRESPGAAGVGMIALAGTDGQLAALPADRLCELLRSHGVRLVVLSACHTARRDARGVWNSLAMAMLKARIPAVVAMQTRIRDDLAAAFSAAFYRALVAGFTLDYAVAVGRTAVRAASGDGVDWAVPVLYARGDLNRIFPPVADPAAQAQAERELSAPASVQVNQQIGRVVGPVFGEFRGDIASFVISDSQQAGDFSDRAGVEAPFTCATCSGEVPPQARFCPNCGAAVGDARSVSPRFCAQCGGALSAAARFCPTCGASAG